MKTIARRLTRLQVLLLILLPALALAAIVTAAQVAQAVLNSPNASTQLKQYATAIGDLAINVESSGNTTAYNGSCCYGILQMTGANILKETGLTPAQYQQLSLQDQVDAWATLTSPLFSSWAVQKLSTMTSFDGRPVDGNLILACMQLGVGNCQTMILSSSCSGFADKNGTTICSMADKIANGSSSNGSSSSGGGGNTGGGSSNGGGSGSPINTTACIRDASGACEPINQAMADAFQSGAGFSMSETKSTIYAIIAAGMMLLAAATMKDAWRIYAKGGINVHVLFRVIFSLAVSVTFVLMIMSYT